MVPIRLKRVEMESLICVSARSTIMYKFVKLWTTRAFIIQSQCSGPNVYIKPANFYFEPYIKYVLENIGQLRGEGR